MSPDIQKESFLGGVTFELKGQNSKSLCSPEKWKELMRLKENHLKTMKMKNDLYIKEAASNSSV